MEWEEVSLERELYRIEIQQLILILENENA